MNNIINKFLLTGDKFMPEMHLRQPRLTYSACGPFTKNKERIEKFMKTGNTDFIYKNKLDKACFQLDMVYGKSKNLVKRDVTDDSFAEYNEESNKRNPKFKVGDHVRLSKYKNIFAKGYAPNWSEEIEEICY